MKIPDGYQQVMPYLIVRDATKFVDFTSKVFGAVEKLKSATSFPFRPAP